MRSAMSISETTLSPEDEQQDFLTIDSDVMQDTEDKHTSLENLYGYDILKAQLLFCIVDQSHINCKLT